MIQKYVLYVLYIGEFWQTPYCHLKGQNCPLCSHRAYKYTTEEYIKRAKEVHGDKYDYSKVEYIDNKTKILKYNNNYIKNNIKIIVANRPISSIFLYIALNMSNSII